MMRENWSAEAEMFEDIWSGKGTTNGEGSGLDGAHRVGDLGDDTLVELDVLGIRSVLSYYD